ncbi:Zinc finger, FYVE-related [Phytophthora cactorum]|nr:Zinc finger, FYVE-related [Phytophthora cactorum]
MALNAKAKELLRELQRSDWLPPYNTYVSLNNDTSKRIAQELHKYTGTVYGDGQGGRRQTASGGTKPVSPKKPATKKSSSFVLPIVSAAVVALAVGCAKYADVPLNADSLQSLVGQISSFGAKPGLVDSSTENVPYKYETEMVAMQVRHLVSELKCNDSDYSATTLFDGKMFHVTEPMEAEQPMADDRVFFMLNGANDGVYVSWNGQFECVGKAAEVAAAWLGADRDVMVNGVRLYSQMGWPVRNEKELRKMKNIVHVLLDFQLWQWPGIKKGYKYVLEDGVTLTTVGMSPKVLDVEYFINQEEADKVIEIGSPKLDRSKVDGSNSSKVVTKSRTSHTAFLPDSLFTRDFQKRSARVARLPSPSYVERMQLVRYAAGEFYRQHFDTFHSREFLPKGADSFDFEDYVEWTKWAAEKLRSLDRWIRTNLDSGADNMMKDLMEEKRRPSFTVEFQEKLVGFILDDYTKGFITRLTNPEWYDWLVFNRGRNHVLFQAMQAWPQFAELAIRTWEARVGNIPELRYKLPEYVQHFHPQRFVTLFLYLNNQTKIGGETVFPFSLDRYSEDKIVRDGMDECSSGLAVPPLGLHASLFYVQTPEGVPDVMSRHGGCPPDEGIKWGANSFMWDSDSEEGADLWTTNVEIMAEHKEKTPDAKAAANKPPTKARGSGSVALKLLPVLVVVLAVAGGWLIQQGEDFDDVALKVLRDTGLLPRVPSSVLDTLGLLPDKYETDLVKIEPRHLVSELKCNDSDYSATTLFNGKVFHVTEPMEAEQPMTDDRVFFMLNGANDGVYVQMGWPVRNEKELRKTKNIVHVLLDFQLWQWPGIKKGYKYVLEDGVTLTMVGTRPKVFDVEYFLTQEEADKVIELGSPFLDRSKVDGTSAAGSLQRGGVLPQAFGHVCISPFLPKGAEHKFGMKAYKEWANWAAAKIRELSTRREIPESFREGGPLFPNAEDKQRFPNALAKLFYPEANATNLFKALSDEAWLTWLDENVNNNALGVALLRVGAWAKERINFLGDEVPTVASPSGELYPMYTIEFQEMLLGFVLDDHTPGLITRITNAEWYDFMVEHRGENHILFKVLKAFPQFAELVIKTWESRVRAPAQLRYTLPAYVKHFHPQRYVTLFLYLNNQTKIGGETVFPYSLDRYSDEKIVRDGMDECSSGLAVPPLGLHASLFYVQTPEGDVDQLSRHGGCPPHEGTKWGSNSFMWDSDADEAADLWTTNRGGLGKVGQRELEAETVEELVAKVSDRLRAQFNELMDLSPAAAEEQELLYKYDDETLVAMEVRHLVSDLSCSDDSGRNEGVYVSWNGDFNCIGKAAELAAAWLGADRDVMENGVRLYNQMGFGIRSAEGLAEAKNIVHILLDFQLWQWPGIEKGHQYVLEDGVVLTTVAMSPKVFDVQYFLTQNESEKIMELGMPGLARSKVDGSNSSKITSKSLLRLLTSTTAAIQRREFYRQHFDTFHSRDFLPKDANAFYYEDYEEWTKWAAAKLRSLDQSKLAEEFRDGGALFPNSEDQQTFPNALLEVFYQKMVATNMFKALFDEERPSYLPRIVQAWEEKLGRGELRYTFPKPQVNGQSHYYNWVRWAKERVSYLGDDCPPIARPYGDLYPQYTVEFQERLLEFVYEDYSDDFIIQMTNEEWFKWLKENRGRNLVLFQVLKAFPHFAELIIRTWETRVRSPLLRYKLPKYVKHFHPQRYVTLFMYLNNQTKIGGETVFPFALDRFSDENIVRDGMDECSKGLAVPPRGLHASLFYTQTPEGDIDDMSRHGGCPPHEGTKWGSNAFMWDSDADEGAELWTTNRRHGGAQSEPHAPQPRRGPQQPWDRKPMTFTSSITGTNTTTIVAGGQTHQAMGHVHNANAAAESKASKKCSVCGKSFNPLRRRHYCRTCTAVVCSSCSISRKVESTFEGAITVRMCVSCKLSSIASQDDFYDRIFSTNGGTNGAPTSDSQPSGSEGDFATDRLSFASYSSGTGNGSKDDSMVDSQVPMDKRTASGSNLPVRRKSSTTSGNGNAEPTGQRGRHGSFTGPPAVTEDCPWCMNEACAPLHEYFEVPYPFFLELTDPAAKNQYIAAKHLDNEKERLRSVRTIRGALKAGTSASQTIQQLCNMAAIATSSPMALVGLLDKHVTEGPRTCTSCTNPAPAETPAPAPAAAPAAGAEPTQEEMEMRLMQLLSQTTSTQEQLRNQQGQMVSAISSHSKQINDLAKQLERMESTLAAKLGMDTDERTLLPRKMPTQQVRREGSDPIQLLR